MSLKKKIFGAFLIFIILPLLALSWGSFTLSQRLIETKFSEQNELTLKAIGRNIRYVLKEANYFSDYYAIMRGEIQGIYKEMYWRSQPTEERNELNSSFERNIRQTVLTYQPIVSVALFSSSGSSYAASNLNKRLISFDKLKESPVYDEVLARNGTPRWIGPTERPELGLEGSYYYQVRLVKDFYNLEDRGIMLLQVQFGELENIFNLYNTGSSSNRRFLLMGPDGLVHYDNNNQELQGKNLYQTIKGSRKPSHSFESEKLEFGEKPSIVSFQSLELEDLGAAGWSVVSITPLDDVSGQLTTVMGWIAFFLTVILGFAFIFNFVFVNRIIRFILRVVGAMKRVELGDLSIRVKAQSEDETSVLSRGFNSMAERISDLLSEIKREQERKNKAELMLLQAQIKPHFLFNTLESINILAVQNEGRKVSQMVRRLGNILRISIHHKEEISVRQELEHLTSYMEIQSYRFEDLFEYELDVPEELMHYTVQKLTLQPLVENCIQHGFEGIEYKGLIRIRVRLEAGNLVFYVEDNGIGIPPERLTAFQYATAMNQSLLDAKVTYPFGERHGLGVNNVADRIRIHFGPGYGLLLCSRPGHGTIIKCTIPAIDGEGKVAG
ncbi:sensor histidine kinase [Paenibacillus sp. MBLB4367]|uniref:sensor histidine kinase n=1 Tax=Paenibacillus sp. MBLB4367 TaxID=3384767 RepID=UPI0039080F64